MANKANKSIDEVWLKVKENFKKLSECQKPHDFEQIGEGVRRKYVCKKCDGEISVSDYHWYRRGVEDGLISKERKG